MTHRIFHIRFVKRRDGMNERWYSPSDHYVPHKWTQTMEDTDTRLHSSTCLLSVCLEINLKVQLLFAMVTLIMLIIAISLTSLEVVEN